MCRIFALTSVKVASSTVAVPIPQCGDLGATGSCKVKSGPEGNEGFGKNHRSELGAVWGPPIDILVIEGRHWPLASSYYT